MNFVFVLVEILMFWNLIYWIHEYIKIYDSKRELAVLLIFSFTIWLIFTLLVVFIWWFWFRADFLHYWKS